MAETFRRRFAGVLPLRDLNPWTEAKVDTKNPERGTLLIINGEKDSTVPWAIAAGDRWDTPNRRSILNVSGTEQV